MVGQRLLLVQCDCHTAVTMKLDPSLWIQIFRILNGGAVLQIKVGKTVLSFLMDSEKSI